MDSETEVNGAQVAELPPPADETPVEPEKGGYKTRRGRAKNRAKDKAGSTVAAVLKLPAPKFKTMKLKNIKVRNRIRQDMGDIGSLAEMIRATNGPLHPVVVRLDPDDPEKGELVSGERRYRAMTDVLHMEEATVRILEGDKSDAKLAEVVENCGRKPFTPREAWEGIQEAEKAIKTMLKAQGKNADRFPPGMGERDELLGEWSNMDATTVRRLRTIFGNYEKSPKKLQMVVDQLEEDGNISKAARTVQKAIQKSSPNHEVSEADRVAVLVREADRNLSALMRNLDDLGIRGYKETFNELRKKLIDKVPDRVD